MRDKNYTTTSDFLAEFFGAATEHAVELRSLPNERGAAPAKPLFGRDLELAEDHCARWDQVERGMFFGVCTRLRGRPTGSRADLAECPALWTEVDTRKLGLVKDAVRQALTTLPFPPSVIIDSGGGLHFYWLLTEAIDVQAQAPDAAETEQSIVAVLKQLAGICAGDTAVCDLARIMRLPGTHNTKPAVMEANGGVPFLVTVLAADWTRRYEFDDLVEWLDWQRPVVARPETVIAAGKTGAGVRTGEVEDPYAAAARALGFKPPIDVETALEEMTYLADGDRGVHQTQLKVSAALVAQGAGDEEIVALLLAATHRAVGSDGSMWNWVREEKAIRQMIASARKKFDKPETKPERRPEPEANPEPVAPKPPPVPEPACVAAAATSEALVVDLGTERRKRRPKANTTDPERKAAGKTKKTCHGDDELALAFSNRHAGTLRYVAKWGQWLRWDGARWAIDETLFVQEAVRDTLRDIILSEATRQHELSISAGTVAAVERLARSDRRHAATAEQFDADPWLLNTPGGIVDLRTGSMTPCDPTRHCSKATAVEPAPILHDECPIWHAFLNRVLNNDQKLVEYLQKVVGYSLTGVTTEQQLWFLYGTGRNGKGVLINTITGILGSYACVANMEAFTASFNDRHSTELAKMVGARMVSAQETEEGRNWAESRIKSLTGGDPISARFMRQDEFTFTPQFKLWFAGNHKPGLRNVDPAMAARVNLVPFKVYFAPHERDPKLPEKLREEWPSILRWAIDGCLKWQREGLGQPPDVKEATDKYISDEDTLAIWLAEATETEGVRPTEYELAVDLFASWKAWAEAASEHVGSMKRFSQKLMARGFEHGLHPRTRKARFGGIRLIRKDYTDDPRWGG